MRNWTEDDSMTPEQERIEDAKMVCRNRGLDPDEVVADGGIEAWMVVYDELFGQRVFPPEGPYGGR